jgi:hypothetical protein
MKAKNTQGKLIKGNFYKVVTSKKSYADAVFLGYGKLEGTFVKFSHTNYGGTIITIILGYLDEMIIYKRVEGEYAKMKVI